MFFTFLIIWFRFVLFWAFYKLQLRNVFTPQENSNEKYRNVFYFIGVLVIFLLHFLDDLSQAFLRIAESAWVVSAKT